MELIPGTERLKAFICVTILALPLLGLKYRYSDFLPEGCSLAAFVSVYRIVLAVSQK